MTEQDFATMLLVLFASGWAISASMCAVLLKRAVVEWWNENYGVGRFAKRPHRSDTRGSCHNGRTPQMRSLGELADK